MNQLRAFVAVARAGGFGAAARELNVSQPTLTTQVRMLEDRYGVELFRRAGRGVALTDTGKRLFALTGQVAAIEQEARQLLQDAGELRSGRLAIGAVSPYQVTDMVAEFTRRFPEFEVQVRFGNSAQVLDDLLAFRTDVGVLAHFDGDARLVALPYSRDRIVALLPREHPLARRRRLRVAELEGQRMVVREVGSTARRVFDAVLSAAGIRPHVVVELGTREAIREAVAKGIGIGTVAAGAHTPDPRVRVVPFSDTDAATHTHVYCLRVRQETRTVAEFMRIAAALAPLARPSRQRIAAPIALAQPRAGKP